MADQPDRLLSERQIEILRLAAKGATNQQIAVQLDITENTVKAHLRNIYSKIGVSSRTEATLYAERAGLLSPPRPMGDPGQKLEVAEPSRDLDSPSDLNSTTSDQARDIDGNQLLDVSSLPSPSLPPPVMGRNRERLWWLGGGTLAGALFIGLLTAVIHLMSMTPWFEPGPATSLASTETTPQSSSSPLSESTMPLEKNTALAHARIGFGLSSYDGKIYVIGGETQGGVSELVARYNPQQDSWVQVAPLPYPLADIQAVEIGGKLYVAGGRTATGTISSGFLMYDPVRDQWQSLPPLPAPRSRYAATALEGKYYLFGGWDGHDYGAQVWVFSPATNSWDSSSPSPMPEPRADTSAVPIGKSIHLLGGRNADGPVVSHYAYTPSQDARGNNPWRVLPPLPWIMDGPMTDRRMPTVAVIDSIYMFDSTNGKLRIYDTGQEAWNVSDITLPKNTSALQAILVNTRLFMLGSTKDGEMYHFSYQAIYRTQLPIITK